MRTRVARSDRRARRALPFQTQLNAGDNVIIRRNPHLADAGGIVGTVVQLRVGQGCGGSDLVDVSYMRPCDGKRCTMPFAPSCLEPASHSALLVLAVRHEAAATVIRMLLG
jgi:hypothetical protein